MNNTDFAAINQLADEKLAAIKSRCIYWSIYTDAHKRKMANIAYKMARKEVLRAK